MALFEYFNDIESVNYSSAVFDDSTDSQNFTPEISHKISGIKVYGKRYWSGSSGTLDISIQGVDGSGDPDGNTIASGSVSINGWSTSWPGTWLSIPFDTRAVLDAGTTYVIIYDSTGLTGEGGEEDFDALAIRGINLGGGDIIRFYEDYGWALLGFPWERSDFYDEDVFWDEANEQWVSNSITGGGSKVDYIVSVGDQGEIYFLEV